MLGAARARIAELETSTTWRATAPLRESGHRVKIAWAHARAQWSALRQSPHYVGVAASVLRNEGPGALAKRIVRRLSRPHRYVPPPGVAFAQETAIVPLAFEVVDKPRVSIIVPMYGKPLFTYTCLKSVHANTLAGSYEVIVVDDASPEPASKTLAAVTGVRFERNAPIWDSSPAAIARPAWRVARSWSCSTTIRSSRPAGWMRCWRCSIDTRMRSGRREARIRMAGRSGRHRLARRLGLELRSRRRPGRPVLSAPGRLLLRACLAVPPPVRRARRLRCPLRASVLRGHRSRVRRGAPRGRRVYYQPAATIVHFEVRPRAPTSRPVSSVTRRSIAPHSQPNGRKR